MVDTIHSDLLEAFKKPGCPVCLLEQRAVEAYMQAAFREKDIDLTVRKDIRDSLGLCREHTRRLLVLHLNGSL